MKKVFHVICVIVVCLCLLRNLFGIVDMNEGDPDAGINSGFSIEAKFERFASSDVFDYDQELVELQALQWYFQSAVAVGSANPGDWYATYEVILPSQEPTGSADYEPELWSTVVNTKGVVIYNVWRTPYEKGAYGGADDFGNLLLSIVQTVGVTFKLIGVFLVSTIQTLAELAKLFIDIVFLP